ncbi:ATP-binding protein [Terribacillus sp. 7520-G]|uniref:ATP-binding protein n=1 Tax=Terribacillus TaxID=459532 RepID=UPI000BA742A5|nr:ATP-binding protein [Terribacillus sp. 7520-G]PAD38104.1 CRISPR-associated protein Cas2 [Terribacillus sp. 7520-G]
MERFVIMTVGKTHSGKTTFAKELKKDLRNAVVIDQDVHALFLRNHYQELLPQSGPNDLKYAITQTIIDYAVKKTDAHLIISNANLNRTSRTKLLDYYRNQGFTSIIVYFDLPETTLRRRIADGNRDTAMLRTVSGFGQILDRQMDEAGEPSADEADHQFVIRDENDVLNIINKILSTIKN